MPKDLSGAQVGMAPHNNVNNPRPDNLRGRNLFPQVYQHLTTDRYGEWSPFFWQKCERGDIVNFGTDHDLHTFTLVSPMIGKVNMRKSFVKVPMEAIYPRTWEKQFTIPTQGDDVPNDCRALLNVTKLIRQCVVVITDSSLDSIMRIKSLLLLECLISHGSLLERFNIHLGVRVRGFSSVDDFFNQLWSAFLDYAYDNALSFINDNDQIIYIGDPMNSTDTVLYVSKRRFLEILRSNTYSFTDAWEDILLDDILPELSLFYKYDSDINADLPAIRNDPYINIEPIIAYQLACSQFATNDHVDFIYSAQLYRDNMQSIISDVVGTDYFVYNGVRYLYDVFSQHYFDLVIDALKDFHETFDFFLNLFSYVPSLRYGDYFTGARPQPLSVGEYSAEVNNNEVSAIDITRSIQMQRLLNRVNMVGRKIGDYLSGIFGGQLPEAPKDVPVFLVEQYFPISGFETNNTGSEQFDPDSPNTITSHLRSDESRHAFDVEIAEPCYLIGMNSYEIMRVYSSTIDRFAFHHDRYDDFIPEMQYIGDQSILRSELTGYSGDQPFGYALRYMEYKQRYSYASGGFVHALPSWAFITDNSDGNPSDGFISPEYIRSSPSEFDRFYKSLNGYSLGSYFHFIVCHTNMCYPYRQMEYAPTILK